MAGSGTAPRRTFSNIMEQLPKISLKDGMRLRKEMPGTLSPESHPSDALLTAMAGPGGLEAVASSTLDHLADCPVCMEQWAAAVKKNREKIYEAADDWYGGGFLEAAATEGEPEPLTLHSSCGQFCLRLLPEASERKKGEKGLVTFDVIDGKAHSLTENSWVEVRDADNRVVLYGRLVGGRTAAFSSQLGEYNLSSWTVVISFRRREKE